MIGSINIRVNAAQPNKQLCDLFAFQGSPSSIRVLDVPRSIGDWEITSVKLVVAYPNNNTVERVATRVGNVWVATIEGCAICGKVESGYEILADGIDEQGNPVEGYVLGKGNVFVLENSIDVERLVSKFTVRYLKNLPDIPCAGDLVEFNGVMKLYDGHDWISMGGDVNDTTITIQKNGVEVGSFTTNASEATTIDIPVPSTTSDLNNDSGFITSAAIPSKVSELDNDAGYITMSAIPAIPSKTSELDNDSGFITASAIPSQISSFENDAGYITASAIPSTVSSFENDVGYITASQVQPATSAAFSGFAQNAFAAAQLNAYDSLHGFNDHTTLKVDTYGYTLVKTEYFPSWNLAKYYDAEYSPSVEMVWTYVATISWKVSGRIRQRGVYRWGWAGSDENGVRYFLTSTEEDQWAEDWTTGKFYKWTATTTPTTKDITLSSDEKSIETIDGLTDQITCTRIGKGISVHDKVVAYTYQIPSSVSQLMNDVGYITASAIPSDISAFNNDVGYLSAVTWNDVSGKPNIPSNTSDLVNDSGFITANDIPAIPSKTSDLTNDSGFVTASTVAASYYNKNEIDGMIGSINTILDNINGEVI